MSLVTAQLRAVMAKKVCHLARTTVIAPAANKCTFLLEHDAHWIATFFWDGHRIAGAEIQKATAYSWREENRKVLLDHMTRRCLSMGVEREPPKSRV